MTTGVTRRGSIPAAMAWMIGLSIALSWVPFLGSLVAGYVGKEGGPRLRKRLDFQPGRAVPLNHRGGRWRIGWH